MPTLSSVDPSQRSSHILNGISRESINSSTSPEAETLAGADIAELDLFPEYLAGAVQRYDTTPKTAAVTIRFPANSIGDVNCGMFIEVLPNKVERLASLLFNAHLETNGNMRELILPGGLCVIPTKLQGSPPESFTNVFGSTMAAAIESAPYRKIEVSESGPRVATRCVTMSECSDASKGALIMVALGRREASKIYEKLFRSKSKSHCSYPAFLPVRTSARAVMLSTLPPCRLRIRAPNLEAASLSYHVLVLSLLPTVDLRSVAVVAQWNRSTAPSGLALLSTSVSNLLLRLARLRLFGAL